MEIHLGRRASLEGWTSFESDPLMRRTKDRLNKRCLPCMTGLWEQLRGDVKRIHLKEALECWKVTVALESYNDCYDWLTLFSKTFPGEEVYGKFGKGAGGHKTFAVIFHTESKARRDELMALAKRVNEENFPGVGAVYSRGCGIPYEQLLGPWQGWCEDSPIINPEIVNDVKRSLRKSLFRA